MTVAGRDVRLAGGTSTKRWHELPLTPTEAMAAADSGLVLNVGLKALEAWCRREHLGTQSDSHRVVCSVRCPSFGACSKHTLLKQGCSRGGSGSVSNSTTSGDVDSHCRSNHSCACARLEPRPPPPGGRALTNWRHTSGRGQLSPQRCRGQVTQQAVAASHAALWMPQILPARP